MKKNVKRLLPWAIAAVIFYFLFRQIPPGQVIKTIPHANIPLFAFYAITYFVVVMLLDCVGLRWALTRFSTRVNLKETILMRGATYLLMLINYNLAQGGIAFYLKKTHKAPIFKTLGTISYLTMVDLTLVVTCAVLAVQFQDVVYRGESLRGYITRAGLLFYSVLIFWVIFWKNIDRPIFRPALKWKIVEWFTSRPLFATFREASAMDDIKMVFFRMPIIFLIVVSFFLWIHAFRASIPFSHILIFSPVIMLISTLPITPGGIGTVQALCIEFFRIGVQSPLISQKLFSTEEVILAASLLWGFGNFLLKIAFGFFCLKQKSKSLFTAP